MLSSLLITAGRGLPLIDTKEVRRRAKTGVVESCISAVVENNELSWLFGS